MATELKVNLLPGWEDITHENPEGPPTFVRSAENAAGVLQMSIQALHETGAKPNPTYAELIRLSEHVAGVQEATVTQRFWGDCQFGTFGCIVGNSAELPLIQIWTLSNGGDFLLATYLCVEQPSEQEMQETETIVKSVQLRRTGP
jgi:hypothetical protein